MAVPPVRPTPKLSIGLPVYDAQEFLPQALDCLLAQTLANFEIVISDNASADRTEQICRMSRTSAPSPISNGPSSFRPRRCSNGPRTTISTAATISRAASDCSKMIRPPSSLIAVAFIGEDGQPFPFVPSPKSTSIRRGEQRAKLLELGGNSIR